MELWIRSQNRTALIKYDNVEVGYGVFGYTIICENDSFRKLMGHYETEARALEILDEIQEAQLGNYHYRCPSNVKVSNNENTIVYEIPQE